MWTEPRPRRPYEKKMSTKGGALIFGLGLSALLATIGIVVGVMLPNISPHIDNLSYRARSYYRKLIPHPEYLPTPVPAVSEAGLSSSQGKAEQIEMNLPPVSSVERGASEAIPAAINLTEDNVAPEENQPLPPATNVTLLPVAAQVQLTGFTHQWQTWNNCGPATVTMYMSHFGRPETQVEAAPFLKPNRDDKNVNPHELAAYVRTTGLQAMVRQGGTIDQLKTFLSNNLPVMAETWLIHDGDGLGHYRLVTGYDDATRQFNTFDSLNGPDYKVGYEQFEADWRVFNRLYVVIYPPEQRETALTIIGQDIDDIAMYEQLLTVAQAEIEADPTDAIAFFNQGEALTRLKRFQEAVMAFDRARQLGLHWRRLWYQFTPYEAYYAVGRYQDVLDLAEMTLKGTGGLEEAYYFRGLALYTTGQSDAAVEDFQAALDHNPLFTPAAEVLSVLLADR